jgi:FMN phosphatase YigB (HAD superfamily)
MPNTMLARIFCFRGSDKNTGSSSSPHLPSTPIMRPETSTTTSTPPNEKMLAAEIQANGESSMSSFEHSSPDTARRTLILDLGDVLFHYAVRDITAVSPSTFKAIIKSPPWADLECGRVTEDVAISRISKSLSLDTSTICEALSQCRSLLHVDYDLFSKLVELKKEMNGKLKIVAMTNISKGDFARLKVLLPDWNELFDGDFTSFGAGRIKPDLGYYQHVVDSIGLTDPDSAVFVDDKLVNVDAARSFGIHGIVFESPDMLIRQLRCQLIDSNSAVLAA